MAVNRITNGSRIARREAKPHRDRLLRPTISGVRHALAPAALSSGRLELTLSLTLSTLSHAGAAIRSRTIWSLCSSVRSAEPTVAKARLRSATGSPADGRAAANDSKRRSDADFLNCARRFRLHPRAAAASASASSASTREPQRACEPQNYKLSAHGGCEQI